MAVDSQVQKAFFDWLKTQTFWPAPGLQYEMLENKLPSVAYFAEPGSTRATKYISAKTLIIDFLFRIEYKVKGDDTNSRVGGTLPINALCDFLDGLTDADRESIPLGEGRACSNIVVVEMPVKLQQRENNEQVFSGTFRLTYKQRK